MLRITLEQWRMFLSVVEFGGFNQASVQVFKSQSSIHNAVKKIEQSLGVKLFVVEGRKTTLTDAGKMMLRRAQYLLDEAENVEAIGQTLSQGIESELKIAVDEIFPRALLYQAFEHVSMQYPLLQIELFESILSGSKEKFEQDEVDMAISPYSSGLGVSEQLCFVDFLAVASPEHPLHQQNQPLTLEDLKGHRQIVVRDSARLGKTEGSNEGWLKADQRWTVSHLQSSIDIICQGLGYAWLPFNLIDEHLANQRLKPLDLALNSQRSHPLFLSFKDADRLGPAAKMLINTLRTLCRSKIP